MQPDSIVERAQAIVPLIREERAEGDERARLTKRGVDACGHAGLFRMSAPAEVGGLEAPLCDVIAAVEAVSGADPAAGWYVQNSIPGWRVAAQLDASERARVYENPDLHFGNAGQNQGRAIEGDGGVRLSGVWPVVTGVDDAAWCFMLGMLMDGDAPRLEGELPATRIFVVPTSELEVSQTWQAVSAMRGTASNRVEARDVFVPASRVIGPASPIHIDRAYTRTPALAFHIPAIGGVVCGVLAGVLDELAHSLSHKSAGFTGEARRDQAASQELIAGCRAHHRAVRAGLYEVAARFDAAIAAGDVPDDTLRADTYAAGMYAIDACRRMASDIFAGGTRDAFVRGNAMEMGLRDLHAIGYIMAAARFLVHAAGRKMLGGELDPGM